MKIKSLYAPTEVYQYESIDTNWTDTKIKIIYFFLVLFLVPWSACVEINVGGESGPT